MVVLQQVSNHDETNFTVDRKRKENRLQNHEIKNMFQKMKSEKEKMKRTSQSIGEVEKKASSH